MNGIYELPPELSGEAPQQISQLREYLLRLVLRLNEEGNK